MTAKAMIPWEKVNSFILKCGEIRNSKALSIYIVENITELVKYDQARIHFINDNGLVNDTALFGVDTYWHEAYLEYYSKIKDGLNSPTRLTKYNNCSSPQNFGLRNWTCCSKDEFIQDYIRPQGINFSLGFSLHDSNDYTKCIISLDRTGSKNFSENDVSIIKIVQAHLDNLHKNMFIVPEHAENYSKASKASDVLTPREVEIAELLCKGVTPANISKKACISRSTVYRHIANIHKKLDVSNCQELILKLLDELT